MHTATRSQVLSPSSGRPLRCVRRRVCTTVYATPCCCTGIHKIYEQRNLAPFVNLPNVLDAKLVFFQDQGLILLLAFIDTAVQGLENSEWTIKSDVWSFGILLSEMCTKGEDPCASSLACLSSNMPRPASTCLDLPRTASTCLRLCRVQCAVYSVPAWCAAVLMSWCAGVLGCKNASQITVVGTILTILSRAMLYIYKSKTCRCALHCIHHKAAHGAGINSAS